MLWKNPVCKVSLYCNCVPCSAVWVWCFPHTARTTSEPTSVIRSCKSSVSIKKPKTALSLSFPSPSGESPLLLTLLTPPSQVIQQHQHDQPKHGFPKKCPRTVCFTLFLSIDIGAGQKRMEIFFCRPPPLPLPPLSYSPRFAVLMLFCTEGIFLSPQG